MADRIDQRRAPRTPCNISVEHKPRGRRVREGRITNLRTSGMLLTMQGTAPPVGADLLFRFRLPRSTHPVQAVGSVRWISLGKAGVKFVRLSPQEQHEIQTYCASELGRQRKTDTSEHPLD